MVEFNIDWSLENSGAWPNYIKTFVILLVCFLFFIICFNFDLMQEIDALQDARSNEIELKTELEQKYNKIKLSEITYQKTKESEELLNNFIATLPKTQDSSKLLDDISRSFKSSGLELKFFKPGDLIKKDFYSELPIMTDAFGDYSSLNSFATYLTSLPVITTIHNPTITLDKSINKIMISATLKVYYGIPISKESK